MSLTSVHWSYLGVAGRCSATKKWALAIKAVDTESFDGFANWPNYQSPNLCVCRHGLRLIVE